MDSFQQEILAGIPEDSLPEKLPLNPEFSHAPRRTEVLNSQEKSQALANALRYIPQQFHQKLASEFADELDQFGRIYMYRYRPSYAMKARKLSDYPARSQQAAGIMLMIQNNLDPKVAQHPEELITYGGNGAVFQNWAQYRLTMQYLATMTDDQTLTMYSGHPLGLFPSNKEAPRAVVTNGLVIPNYSKPHDWNRLNALGVSQYGQMTAGSYMYIGPQGIVHGTTITLLNAARKISTQEQETRHNQENKTRDLTESGSSTTKGRLFVSSGLGGMSGAQPKAGNIAGVVSITAEINPHAAKKRHQQGWVDQITDNLEQLVAEVEKTRQAGAVKSFAYVGNVVDLWEHLAQHNIQVDMGSDQTSLHNPFSGGYYPVGLSLDQAQKMMVENPEKFKEQVNLSLKRHVAAINQLTRQGMYFFDYGNAFLLQASRAKADILKECGTFKYASYVEDIMGPMCFDYGFGPFRWVCSSALEEDLEKTDQLAEQVLARQLAEAEPEIRKQIADNLQWIQEAQSHQLVVGSQARILYSDAKGRVELALAFNKAIRDRDIESPIILGRDHHDVSGTDSPYRETANIKDGSNLTADMATQNFVGDSFRGATWVSLHNGGGVGWGEVINGGFGMVLDGSEDCDQRIRSMLSWDVNNGVARRSWAQNPGAKFAIQQAMKENPNLKVTLPSDVDVEALGSEAL